MAKNTVKYYRKLETDVLRILLSGLETVQYNTEYIISELEKNNQPTQNLENKMVDYDIDVSLIRMELNKRLWKEST